ncbi:MAG: hypothetical protein QOJ09_627, partial [Actinomycetota bacterium]|nr:hypothetical protein [Actinomycetota bacterium]
MRCNGFVVNSNMYSGAVAPPEVGLLRGVLLRWMEVAGMCETLAGQRGAMAAFATEFDARVLSVSAARRVMREASAIEHMAATVKAMAAARVAEGGDWRRDGYRSPAEAVAKETGSSLGQAIDALRTAEALDELPAVAAAARRGELSPQQAAAVASAAAVAPDEQARLLEEAKRLSLRELQGECGRTKAAHRDPDEQAAKIREQRRVRSWTDSEGMGHVKAQGPVEDIAVIMARINDQRDKVFAEARAGGRQEPSEAYAFDALVRICSGEGSGGIDHKIIWRWDLDSFFRGHPSDDETADVA